MSESKAVTVASREATDLLRPEATFMELMALADTLVKTGFLPQAVKNAPQAVAIILTGRELGIGPMQSLRSVGIINGKPVLSADLQLGLFHRAGGKSHFRELTPTKAVLEFRAPWLVEPHVETFTMEDANRAKLTGKQVWKDYPKAMLRSRVITAGLKSAGFEPCAGMYDPEELGGETAIVSEVEQQGQAGQAGSGDTRESVGAQGVSSSPSQTTEQPASPASGAPDGSTADDTVAVRLRLTMLLKSPCFRQEKWQNELRTRLAIDDETTVKEWVKSLKRTFAELLNAEMVADEIATMAMAEKEGSAA